MRAYIFSSYTVASAVLGLCCEMAQATEITIVSSHGSVSVTQSNHLVPVSASTRLTLPAQIKTGSDGTLDLKDNDSLVHIGPNSTVALPDTGPSGSLVDRYLQSAGSALYNIQSRHGRPMSVETPYLVSVVKGTVFTIAVEEGATSVTLMEGSLDVSAPDVRQHVLLKPNQSIRHSRGENSLTVTPIGAAPGSMTSSGATAEARVTDEVNATEVALVTRDLSEVGAAVSAQHALLSASVARGSAAPGGISDVPPNGASSGSTSGPSGTSGSNPTPPTSGSSGASDPSGSTGNSSSGSSGSTSTGSSGSNDGAAVTPPVGCNGKTNGTGLGLCLGHGKPKP
jgi:hypothetical protein